MGLSGTERPFHVGELADIQVVSDDPALLFSIKHDLCLGWVTLSFHRELGLICA